MGPFYASIKFKTGEEILCYVKTAVPEDDYLIIQNPVDIEEVDIPGVIQGFKIKAWMNLSHQNEFHISGEDIITIKEVDTTVIKFYKTSLKRLDNLDKPSRQNIKKPPVPKRRKEGNRVDLSEDTGLLGSIDNARELLEEMYLMDSKDTKES